MRAVASRRSRVILLLRTGAHPVQVAHFPFANPEPPCARLF